MNLLNRARYPRRQAGQALVEFLAMAAPLLGLFLLMPMIGKYQDIAHATQMASRYAAFDATVHNDAAGSSKPPAQLAAEVRRRYFSRPDAPIKTGDTAGDFDAHRNPLWTDPAGNPLIPRFQPSRSALAKASPQRTAMPSRPAGTACHFA